LRGGVWKNLYPVSVIQVGTVKIQFI
jgi:hypothetical protein